MTDRKHPSAVFWITVASVAVLVGYPLSFGPWIAFYIATHSQQHRIVVPVAFYRPIVLMGENSPAPMRESYRSYIAWWWTLGTELHL